MHNGLDCSDDLEVLEIYSPAVHETAGRQLHAGGRRRRALSAPGDAWTQTDAGGDEMRADYAASARVTSKWMVSQGCAR